MQTEASLARLIVLCAKNNAIMKHFKVVTLIEQLVPLTRKLWKSTKDKMLPTPAKVNFSF